MAHEYKFYEDTDFDIVDGTVIIDLETDIDGTNQPAIIICDDKSIGVELEHTRDKGFDDADIITLYEKDIIETPKIYRLRLRALENNAAYRVIGGI